MALLIIAAVFETWLGLTIVFQFMRPSPRWIKHHKLIPKHVIPKWTFFAPSPGSVDYRIVFQDYRAEEEPVGNIREIPLHVQRSILHAIWNPDKRRRKAFFDIAQQLQQLQQMQPLQQDRIRGIGLGIQMTTPYLAILNVIMEPKPTSSEARYRRFLIVFTTGFDGATVPQPVFASNFHPFRTEALASD
jgi:hypothetical protein